MPHSTCITCANPELAHLRLSWSTPVFTDNDGIGSLGSLHEAGDAFVAVARSDPEGLTIVGSGVMVAPGLLLTATHVLDEFGPSGQGPIFLSFLPEGARAWLPIDVTTVSGPSAFDAARKVVSDMSLVSCTLNSDAHGAIPLHLAPMKVALSLIGERLWAIGFRHQGIQSGIPLVSPMISSGLVTGAFPHGRGERMASPCFEVSLETIGGMSGGAVVNADGFVVGIVSSSIEGGPSYMTLIWEALRMRVKGATPSLARNDTVSLLGASALGQAKLKGDIHRNPWGDVTFQLSDAESDLFVASVPAAALQSNGAHGLSREERQEFIENRGEPLEFLAAQAAIDWLERLPPERMWTFLLAGDIPATLLEGIEAFSVEDFEGVEDLELISARHAPEVPLEIEFYFQLQTIVWTVEMPVNFQKTHEAALAQHFINLEIEGGVARMEFAQRAYFKAGTTFREDAETFGNIVITSSAVIPPRRARFSAATATGGA